MSANISSASRVMIVVAVLLCVGSLGWAVISRSETRQLRAQLNQATGELQNQKTAMVGAVAVDKLRQQLKQREDDYAALSSAFDKLKQRVDRPVTEPAAAVSAIVTTSPASTNTAAVATDRRSWMDRLKEEDPDRYKQMQEDRDRRREQFAQQFQDALTRIDQRLQAAPTQEEANLLTSLADTVGKMDELRKSWQALRELPEQDRREQAAKLGAESMQTYQQLTELRAKDRQLQLQHLANQVGYTDPTASAQFVESVNRIYTETDTSINRMLGFGAGGGWWRGGGPPGGGQPPQ